MHSQYIKKLVWFVALWIVGVITLGIVAYTIRLAILP